MSTARHVELPVEVFDYLRRLNNPHLRDCPIGKNSMMDALKGQGQNPEPRVCTCGADLANVFFKGKVQ